jgi:broad specificity phosphatase PhoE
VPRLVAALDAGEDACESWVPQIEALPHAALVVCHGGSGTMLGALAAGLPLVVMPLFADQYYNARRIEALNAGISVDPPRRGSDRRSSVRVLPQPVVHHECCHVSEASSAWPARLGWK